MMFIPRPIAITLLKSRLKREQQNIELATHLSIFGHDIQDNEKWIPVIRKHINDTIMAVKESEFETLLTRYSILSMKDGFPLIITNKIRVFGLAIN